jgi:hypothetical protein
LEHAATVASRCDGKTSYLAEYALRSSSIVSSTLFGKMSVVGHVLGKCCGFRMHYAVKFLHGDGPTSNKWGMIFFFGYNLGLLDGWCRIDRSLRVPANLAVLLSKAMNIASQCRFVEIDATRCQHFDNFSDPDTLVKLSHDVGHEFANLPHFGLWFNRLQRLLYGSLIHLVLPFKLLRIRNLCVDPECSSLATCCSV